MECPECGAAVVEGQRFCNACGAALTGVTDRTQSLMAEPMAANELPEPAWGADPVAPQHLVAGPDHDAEQHIVGGTDSTPIATRRPPLRTPLDDVADASAQVPVTDVWATTQIPAPSAAEVLAARELASLGHTDPLGAPVVAAGPAVADFADDVTTDIATPPVLRDPPQVRMVLVLSFFAAIATFLAAIADIIDLRTTRPVDGIVSGFRGIDDLGTNLAVGAFIGVVVMVLGAVIASLGLRWGAGIAAGAGLGLAGWACLVIALAEVPIANATAITRAATTEPFTLTVTRDIGWWLVVVVGGLGVAVFVASLRQAGAGGRIGLNPWIAAVGAVVGLAVAAGPLIPVRGAEFADNLRSASGNLPLPDAYFAGRLGQLALIALTAVIGFLLVRRWGLGLVAGGLAVPAWLWVTSLGEFDERPAGIAYANVGADSTVPHGVTTVGIALTVGVLAVAVTAAAVRRRV